MSVLDPGFASREPDVGHIRRCQLLLVRYFLSGGLYAILYYSVTVEFFLEVILVCVCVCMCLNVCLEWCVMDCRGDLMSVTASVDSCSHILKCSTTPNRVLNGVCLFVCLFNVFLVALTSLTPFLTVLRFCSLKTCQNQDN